ALELEICENQEWLCFVKANDIVLRSHSA
ncbi:molybdenum-pterin-binding protein, partial [Campylobacter jejuni]|nr:molybdenum-pterin-binding protein [Campylobacter jejuni]EAM0961188.1 molybdenum-pterin-binding protein [Campylobacter jejuni]EHS2497879.1 molybdenum-pterin-binding protein [Campylobacter jejuni]ELC3935720.1 molybdenum-pterin-binding protein [Campylobacter jejuni]ELM6605865.1 molybdenum-pterin-binding protein [Campylobacter jejuni]